MDSNDAFPPSSGLAEFEQSQCDADETYSPNYLDLFDWNLWSANISSVSVHEEQNNDIFDPATLGDIDLSFRDFDGHAPETTQEPEILGGGSTSIHTHPKVDFPLGVNSEASWKAGPSTTRSPKVFNSPGERETTPIQPSSPSKKRGRLSDMVRTGIEELIGAGGACWRCKILRKKVPSCNESLKQDKQFKALTHEIHILVRSK